MDPITVGGFGAVALAFSAPITAAIIGKFRERSTERVSVREVAMLQASVDHLVADMAEVKDDVRFLKEHLT